MSVNNGDEVMVSTKRAAQLMGVSQRTLYKLIDQGVLPAYRLGRVIRVKVADVDEAVAGSRIAPGSLGGLWAQGQRRG